MTRSLRRNFVFIPAVLLGLIAAPRVRAADRGEKYELTDDDYAWQAAALEKLTMRELIWMKIAAYNSQFGGSSEQIVREFHETMDLLSAQSPDQAFWIAPGTAQNVASLTTILGKIADFAGAGTPGQVVSARISAGLGIVGEGVLMAGRTINEEDRVARSLDSSMYGQLAPVAGDIVQEYRTAMQLDGELATAHDSTLANGLMLYARDDEASIFARNPELAIRKILEKEVRPSLVALGAEVAQANALLAEIIAANDAQIREQQWQDRIANTGAAIDIISRLIGRSNPKLARQVSGVGHAALKVADLVHKIKSGATLGAAGLAFGIAGIAGPLLGAFMDSGPSADEMILEQLQMLSSQIEDVRMQMHQRFDLVDARLDQLIQISVAGFALVRQDLASVSLELRETQRQIADLKWQIARAETNLTHMLRAGFARDLIGSLDRCVGAAPRTGEALSYEDFTDCESVLYLAAAVYSFDDVALSLGYAPTTPDHVLGSLLAGGGDNARFLLTLLAERFGHAAGDVPNPDAWASGADAYATLLAENPIHALRIARNRRATLVSQGNALHETLSLLTVNADGSPNSALWNGLVGFATSKHEDLERALAGAEQRAFARLSETAQTFNLWGGPDQPTPASLDLAGPSLVPCADGGPITVPEDIVRRWVPNAVRNAAVMAGRKLAACWRAAYWDTRSVTGTSGGAAYGKLRVDFEVTADGEPLAERRYQGTTEYLMGAGSMTGGSVSYLASHYVNTNGASAQTAYANEAVDTMTPDESLARDEGARSFATDTLHDYREAFHTAVAGEVSQPGDAFNAAEALAAAPRLLRAVLRLADTSALQRDELLALFGTELPAISGPLVAARYAGAAISDDLFLSVRQEVAAEVDTWTQAANERVQAYLDERAALVSTDTDTAISPADGATARLIALANGPVSMDADTPWALFPMIRVEATAVNDAVVADTRWAAPALPSRFELVIAWNLELETGSEGPYRICVEPQQSDDRLIVWRDGDWAPLELDPTASWLCGTSGDFPTQVALVRMENTAPNIECIDAELRATGAAIPITPELVANTSDDDGDAMNVTVTPEHLTDPGRYDVDIVVVDDWGAEASCTSTVLVSGEDGAGGAGDSGDADGGTGGTSSLGEGGRGNESGTRESGEAGSSGAAGGSASAAASRASDEGCGCRVKPSPRSANNTWFVLAALVLALHRRRRSASAPDSPSDTRRVAATKSRVGNT